MMEELKLDYTELQKTVEKLLPGEFPFTFEELVKGFFSGEMDKGVLAEIGEWMLSMVTFPMEHGVRLMLLILFSALFSNLSKAFSREGTAHMGFLCVYLLLAVHTVSGFLSSLATAKSGMENMCGFAGVLFPTYCISIAVVTGSITAAGYYQGTAFLISFFEFLARFCLLPLTQVYILITVASCVQKRPVFRRLLELIVSLFSWIKKSLLGIALALGAVQGTLAPAVDGLKRTAVIQSASVIPGLGDLIGGAWESVMGAGIVLKNSLGIAGMLFLLLIAFTPLVKLVLQYLVYRVLAAVTEPVTQSMTGYFLYHVGIAQKLLLETLTLGMILFLLLLVVMTKISS